MGNFLALVYAEPALEASSQPFESWLKMAAALGNPKPNSKVQTANSRAALFPRHNGSGSAIARDAQGGDWLLAIGTWFHSSGLASGEETKLLHRYQEAGPIQLAKELEGFFTVVIGDAAGNDTIVITDVAGSCHAFVRQLADGVALSGSSLLLAGLRDSSLDPTGCQEFMHTGIIYEDRTLFAEVKKLGPACVFWFVNGKLRKQHKYWDPAALEPELLRGDAAVEQLWHCVTRSARAVTRAFPNTVCDLTGGYDSRAVVAAFLSTDARFTTTVSGAADSPDVTVSKALAEYLRLPHLHLVADEFRSLGQIKQALWFTDGEYDLIDYARILQLHRSQAEQFQISINGSFGELARGYWWELLVPATGRRSALDATKLARSRYAIEKSSLSFKSELRVDMVPHLARVIERTNASLVSTPNTFQMDNAYLGMRMQRWQGRIASSTNRLWPCLSPFMFRSTLEAMLQTEHALRTRSLMIRHMLASYQPRLANFPLEHGYPAIPASWKNLHRFHPLVNYYGGKVLQRARIKATGHQASSNGGKPARLRIWEEEEVRQLLQPASMGTAALLEERSLQTFLSQSRENTFVADGSWKRLLSLECALSELRGLKH